MKESKKEDKKVCEDKKVENKEKFCSKPERTLSPKAVQSIVESFFQDNKVHLKRKHLRKIFNEE